ncbi:hypothetical protein HGRIS_006711 [Hohenbuehelia grisea]|uniref:Uncharacterized protein n=1 Tax=Hohenbuehelia grisea TaxID=104357 RepID=A0ABR3JAB9_9AGAR
MLASVQSRRMCRASESVADWSPPLGQTRGSAGSRKGNRADLEDPGRIRLEMKYDWGWNNAPFVRNEGSIGRICSMNIIMSLDSLRRTKSMRSLRRMRSMRSTASSGGTSHEQ